MLDKISWRPSKDLVNQANVTKFIEENKLKDYNHLIKKSTEDINWFWEACEQKLQIDWFKDYNKVLDSSKGIAFIDWFIDGKVNLTHNCLDKHKGNKIAFIWQGEDGKVREYSYSKLLDEVNRLGNWLVDMGVGKGDVVTTYLPMLPETVVTLFATIKIGAVFMPIFSGFGTTTIAVRIHDAKPKVIVTCDGYYRRGKEIYPKEVLDSIDFKSKLLVVRRLGKELALKNGQFFYDEVLKNYNSNLQAKEMNPNDPALLLYTSGTTGKPKGCLISHIGAMLQPAKEHYFNMDIKKDDRLFWISDIGWMMGPWQIIGSQLLGASHLITEGVIDYPNKDKIWEIVEKYKITHLGFSATVVRMLKSFGNELLEKHNLDGLKAFGNTGEPIDVDSWLWLTKDVGRDKVPIINLSGGTEIFGCFLLPSVVTPLKPTTLYGPGLGMDIDVFDDNGNSVRNKIGYLVCKKPSPSMTRGFLNDNQRYIDTYWSMFKNVWLQGDLAIVDKDGFWFLEGRSDDVIKISGKRIGPAEVESIINSNKLVVESACIGLPDKLKGEKMVCFVIAKSKDGKIKSDILGEVGTELGKAFMPSEIHFVDDLPRTRSGKIVRRAIKNHLLGKEVGDISTLENPDSLKKIKV